MRSKKNVETVKLDKGETLTKAFDNYVDMAENAVDWTLFCSYQLKPDFSEGIYKMLQLPSMQIVYTDMGGGIMFDYVSPEGSVTFSIMKNLAGKACIDQMKLETDMIIVTDDTKIYNLTCSGQVEFLDISLNQNADPKLRQKLREAVDKYFIDHDQKMAQLIKGFIRKYAQNSPLDTQTSMQIEAEITEAMLKLLEEQEAQTPYFTKSEKIALEIKQRLFKHMDGKMCINDLAKDYTISTKSLQNAFRSLFDISPHTFTRLLKLNLVHHELIHSSASENSVQSIARKWGFVHMGRFSKYYAELFGENPSHTLKADIPKIDGMHTHCVERQEEME